MLYFQAEKKCVKNLKCVAIFCIILVNGCSSSQTTIPGAGATGNVIELSDVYNNAVQAGIGLPPAKQSFDFQNSDQFDLLLSSSLREDWPVTVSFSDSNIGSTALPARLDRWVSKTKNTKGKVYLCPSSSEQNYEVILTVLKVLAEVSYNTWKDYETYKPVKSYNLKVYIKNTDLEKENGKITRMEWMPKSEIVSSQDCKLSS